MKVVLREEVEHLGHRGDVVNVARGYARNYLLPKGLALEATAGNLKSVALRRKAWEVQEHKAAGAARLLAERISALELKVAKKVGEKATLYGSVTAAEIAGLLADQGIEVERRKVQPREPIKSVGSFVVPIKLHRDVTAEVKLEVVPEATSGTGAGAESLEGAEERAPIAGFEAAASSSADKARPAEPEADS